MKVIGVVGTHGKTSVAWMLRQIIEEHGIDSAIMCDIEYAIFDDRLTEEGEFFIPEENDPAHFRTAATPYHHTLFKGRYFIEHTIPDALQVQKVLAGMAYRGAEGCVIECPVEALMDGRLSFIEFDLLVHTNLKSERLDTAKTFEARKKIYTMQFTRLKSPEWQRAIINIDDPHAQDFIDRAAKVPVVTYSLKQSAADVYAEKLNYSIWETEMIIRTPLGKIQLITPMIGQHHVYNILASVATTLAADIELQTIVTAIESLDFVPGRYELIDENQMFAVVVERANTAQRVTAMVRTLRDCGAKRVFVVFGASWEHSFGERKAIGGAVFLNADVAILTSDSPKAEEPNIVINDMVAGFPKDVLDKTALWVLSPWQDPGRVPWWFEEWVFKVQGDVQRHIIEDRSIAIRAAIGTARKGDVVVIAGRGHRDYQMWVDQYEQPLKAWYDDRREARDALEKLPFLRKSQVITKQLPWEQSKSKGGRRGWGTKSSFRRK